MAGAIAGSAIFCCSPTERLDTVTLTVNNACNLACPHCYLQYHSPVKKFRESLFDVLERSAFRHLAVVGKEPLFDGGSVAICERLAALSIRSKKTISLITNGTNLRRINPALFEDLSYIDISLDGGKDNYADYRRASLTNLFEGLAWLRANGFGSLNALHVLNSRTIDWLDDMLMVRQWAPFERIVFSPYVRTVNDGVNTVDTVPLPAIIHALSQSRAFMDAPNAWLLIDGTHLTQSGVSPDEFGDLLRASGLRHKVLFVPEDPIEYGILRVTYDGLVLTPYESLNPRCYGIAPSLDFQDRAMNLQDVFAQLRTALPEAAYAN